MTTLKDLSSMALVRQASHLLLLDQVRLPKEEIWLSIESVADMINAIQGLHVRGAPLIGVAASLSLAQEALQHGVGDNFFLRAKELREARPTAVNLMNCVDRLVKVARQKRDVDAVVCEADAIFYEDVRLCEALANHGASCIQDGDHILTHCNTGGLATVGVGTALGVIQAAHKQGKRIHVYVDETRPLLQGARLTAFELGKLGVPYSLICDNMAGALMQQRRIQKVFVGADRIALNGDFANKVGTYALAVLAHFHKIDFYVVAPHTTLDLACTNGYGVPIEERSPGEVRGVQIGNRYLDWSPEDCPVYNPAFDVTPESLVTAWILDGGIVARGAGFTNSVEFKKQAGASGS